MTITKNTFGMPMYMPIDIPIIEIEAKTSVGLKVVIDKIRLKSREIICGHYIDGKGNKVEMSWNENGINNGALDILSILGKYLKEELAEVIDVVQRLNRLLEQEQ